MRAALLFVIAVLFLALPAQAANIRKPTLDLEKKIAYQQGQFGALYAHCGNANEKTVIGGSLAVWRDETFRGYNGTTSERESLLKEFDSAAIAVMADSSSCQNWGPQADATWHSVVYLSRYGSPAVIQH